MFFNSKYKVLKRMNYLADQQGIITRYLHESKEWAQHLENTKNQIINSAKNKQKESCAILGSGWLLDVPIEFLASTFKKVYLFDVIHPTQIRHKLKQYNNIELIETDVTGGAIKEFYNVVQGHKSMGNKKNVNEFSFNGVFSEIDFDFVVSVNILNQLDILLIDYIKGYNLYSDNELLELRKMIQYNHLKSLPKNKSCLITDFEELIYDTNGTLETSKPLIYIDLPNDKIENQWDWQFDLHQNYVPGKNVVFKVLAINL
jgi:hypothetical protein